MGRSPASTDYDGPDFPVPERLDLAVHMSTGGTGPSCSLEPPAIITVTKNASALRSELASRRAISNFPGPSCGASGPQLLSCFGQRCCPVWACPRTEKNRP